MFKAKTNKEPLIRISRKLDIALWKKIVIKVAAIVVALLVCAIISECIKPGNLDKFFNGVFFNTFFSTRKGVTSFSIQKVINLLWATAILLLITLAVTPCFKMRYWNIGGEGQVLFGAFGSLIIMKFVAPHIGNNFICLFLMLVAGGVFGALWSFIPALFKSLFNTNETLFTLMMNYIAMAIVGFFSYEWRATGKTAIGIVNEDTKLGWISQVKLWDGKSYDYIIGIIIVILFAVALWAFMKYSKHGYEISVVGGSRNTARYVGININRVIIRTNLISGAVAGICGWLLVAGGSHSINETLVNGQGFTGVLLSWLGHFNVLEMAGYSFLVAFVTKGSENAASAIGYSAFVSTIMIGVFFFIIIASEFFVNFNIHFNIKSKKHNKEEVNNG